MVSISRSLSYALLTYRTLANYGFPPEGTPPLAYGLYSTPEIQHPIDLEIVGMIPSWISGSLYRGAHGGWDAGNYTAGHWFDGFSRNHRFELENGTVRYRSRNASDELYDFIEETGFYPGGSFGGDPCKVILGEFETKFRDGNNQVGDVSKATVKVSYIKDFPGLDPNSTNFGPMLTLVATTDGTDLQQIDPTTLEPIELFKADAYGVPTKEHESSAHPAIGSGGQLYNYYLNTEAEPPIYSVFAIEGGRGRILANITDAPPAYIHSVFSTENFVVLIVWQCDIGTTDKPTYNLIDAIMPWDPEREALFYVIRKDDGEVVARYNAPAFFTFHEINSFEKDGDIIVDLPWMANHTWVEALRLGDFRAHIARSNATASFDVPGTFQRFRLSDFANGKTENGTLKVREALVDFSLRHEVGNIELPKINEEYLHKEYRYAYGTHIEKRGYFMDSIIKIDTKTQTSNVWSPETNHVPSEPIFVSRPGAECEDDGVLLTVALDEATRVSSLVVIDAKEMVEIGRARLPIVMGFGFHGIWGKN